MEKKSTLKGYLGLDGLIQGLLELKKGSYHSKVIQGRMVPSDLLTTAEVSVRQAELRTSGFGG